MPEGTLLVADDDADEGVQVVGVHFAVGVHVEGQFLAFEGFGVGQVADEQGHEAHDAAEAASPRRAGVSAIDCS